MSVTYYVACRDCKVTRDLDNFYACRAVETRQEALELADYVKDAKSFHAALLASFMAEHKGHNCTLFTENDDAEMTEFIPDDEDDEPCRDGPKMDKDFWTEAEGNP